MHLPNFRTLVPLAAGLALVWLGWRYVLPLALPFLLGAGLALAAEPGVGALHRRLRLPRPLAAGIGVSLTLALVLCAVALLATAAVRQLGGLARALPDLGQAAAQGLESLEGFLLELADSAPQGVRPLLQGSVTRLMGDGSAILDGAVAKLPGLATKAVSHVPGSALTLGTGVISGFMISARLPRLKQAFSLLPLGQKLKKLLPALKKTRAALWGWLKAQGKLCALSFCIVTGGLLLLGVGNAPVLGLLIALVDAIPVLGTGTVLLPWAVVCLVQGDRVLALGLLGIYAGALVARSVLEPRLVGRQLGLDPLLTLMAMYAGFQLFGFWGMLLSPVLLVAAGELLRARQ